LCARVRVIAGMTRPALTLAAALALSAGGCIGSSSTHSSVINPHLARGTADGSVVGSLKIVGGPPPGTNRPEPHQVFRVLSGSKVVREVTTDGQGRFAFLLQPGTYALRMGPNTPIDPTTLSVAAAQITHLQLEIVAK
jgi:hypothetical protein